MTLRESVMGVGLPHKDKDCPTVGTFTELQQQQSNCKSGLGLKIKNKKSPTLDENIPPHLKVCFNL